MVKKTNLACALYNVSFSYKNSSNVSLSDISLEIPKGQCVVITGKSGCGKSTISRLLNGLIPVVYDGEKTGEVFINGKNINEYAMSELSKSIGSVFQNPRSQFVNMDTTSEIVFGCETLGFSRQKIKEQLEKVVSELGIEHLIDRRVSELSGGEKQLVIFASIFATDTEILLLDEPSASLDIKTCKKLAKTLSRAKKQGKTIIVLEHRLWWLNELADRIIQFDNGKLMHDWDITQFKQLSYSELSNHGLRAFSLNDSGITEHLTKSSENEGESKYNTTALEVRQLNLKRSYGKNIISNLSIDIHPQRAMALIGKNGAGKTSFARMLSGIDRPSSGSIKYKLKELDYKSCSKIIYLIMQEPGYQLFADSVLEELLDAASDSPHTNCHNKDKEELIRIVLENYSLNQSIERHPLSLSGGERQRLSIAAGTLYNSPFMILDEPTSGLDAYHMRQLSKQLQALKHNGLGLVIISHDFEFICACCDEVAVLSDGCIAEQYMLTQDSAHKLKHQLLNEY